MKRIVRKRFVMEGNTLRLIAKKTIVYYLIQTWDWIPEIPDISHKTMLVVLAVAGVAARAVHCTGAAARGLELAWLPLQSLCCLQHSHTNTHSTLHTGNTIETQ